ncbi:hypothetical protein HNV12_28220 [Methanococcoides sp. SA1]|nr:hypothetical protein [Methanococcoides sp. SA1]
MLQEIVSNIGLLNIFIKMYDKHKLKCAFANEIDSDIDALQDAYSDLILSFYLIFGATVIGSAIPPKTPEITIDKIIEVYQKSLFDMENSLIRLGKTLKIHENDLYELIGTDYKSKLLMQNLLASINVEEKEIDWNYLSQKNSLMHVDLKEGLDVDFPKRLDDALQTFSDEFKINNVVVEGIDLKILDTLWLNKNFRRDYNKLINEYSTK